MRFILHQLEAYDLAATGVSMKSFQERFYLHEHSPLKTIWRDIRMIGYILQVIYAWVFVGGPVRRAYRRCERCGKTWWVDELDREDF